MRVLDTTRSIQSTSSYIQIEHRAIHGDIELHTELSMGIYSRVILPSALLRADAETTETHKELLAVCDTLGVLVSYA